MEKQLHPMPEKEFFSEKEKNSEDKKLVINDTEKAALLMHSDLSGLQIDDILEDAALQADF